MQQHARAVALSFLLGFRTRKEVDFLVLACFLVVCCAVADRHEQNLLLPAGFVVVFMSLQYRETVSALLSNVDCFQTSLCLVFSPGAPRISTSSEPQSRKGKIGGLQVHS